MSFWKSFGQQQLGKATNQGWDLIGMGYSQYQQKQARKYNLALSKTEIQRRVEDLKAAGLNPLLAMGSMGSASSLAAVAPQASGLGSTSVKAEGLGLIKTQEKIEKINLKLKQDMMDFYESSDAARKAVNVAMLTSIAGGSQKAVDIALATGLVVGGSAKARAVSSKSKSTKPKGDTPKPEYRPIKNRGGIITSTVRRER